MDRNVYLNTVPLEEAKSIFLEKVGSRLGGTTEKISVFAAQDRVLSLPIIAKISNPHYNASAMDGIALKAALTKGAHERNPLQLKENRDFQYVDTGDPLPEGADAVIMIENVLPLEAGVVEILEAAYPWQNVRVVGEDIVVGEMILPSCHKVRAVDIGAIISAGVTEVEVYAKLRVGIIPTGSEIVNPGSDLKPGDILDSNSRVFEAMVKDAGGEPYRYDPVPDHKALLRNAIIKAVAYNDVVVINAGSSAGSEDFTAALIRELGEVYIHGIAIKPGKPTILGQIDGKPVIGIPGYPVSAFIAFKELVTPLITAGSRSMQAPVETIKAVLSRRVVSSLKHQEFIGVKLGNVDDRFVATPINRGAGATLSLVRSDGLLVVPRASEGFEAGEEVEVELFRKPSELEKTLVLIGSHDILLDWMSDSINCDRQGFSLSSAHVGSLAGLMAIKRGETHMAAIHLLDEATGTYNTSFIQKYLPGEKVFLVKGIRRWQGLYTRPGNPHGIQGLADLQHKNLCLANRQKGSGTRVLLDYKLKQEGISGEQINGYEREHLTHTSVAMAVCAGNADVGMGIQSVAVSMNLDFLPVALEDYDFIIPERHMDDCRVQAFLSLLGSDAFKTTLKLMGGYELDNITLHHMTTGTEWGEIHEGPAQ